MRHPGDEGVDAEPDGPDGQHQSILDIVIAIAGDLARDAVVGLHQDRYRDDPQGESVHQGRESTTRPGSGPSVPVVLAPLVKDDMQKRARHKGF